MLGTALFSRSKQPQQTTEKGQTTSYVQRLICAVAESWRSVLIYMHSFYDRRPSHP